ncbi:O-antigen ligase family protein [Flavobacteriales bacterium]|nr:O-antigen ligase family protein [Flavobacteriales bacterium]
MAFVFSFLFADYELKNKIKSNIYFYFLVTIILISIVLVFATLSKKGLVLVIFYLLSKLYLKKASSLFTKRRLIVFSLFLLIMNFIPSGFISDLSDNLLIRVNTFLAQSNSNFESETGSTSERLYYIDRGINGFFDAPFFGHGFKSFESKFTQYSHNNYIEFLYSFGLFGFFLYYSIYFKIYKMAFNVDTNTKVLFLFSLLCFSFIDIAAVTYATKIIQYFICVLFILFENQQHKVNNNGQKYSLFN